jgi:hypothetical protein
LFKLCRIIVLWLLKDRFLPPTVYLPITQGVLLI